MFVRTPIIPVVTLALALALAEGAALSSSGFDRTYATQGPAHLTISNTEGDINVTAWNRRTISVRASASQSASIEDHVAGNNITVSVNKNPGRSRATFEVMVPSGTSLSLHNVLGRVNVKGVNGHIMVSSFDGDVRLLNIRAASVDVKVTTGNIYFDGTLQRGGTYSLQSVKGDIDITLPGSASFDLIARALNENINLGDFAASLTGGNRGAKGITGTYLQGGPRLSLTTYSGRILLHRR